MSESTQEPPTHQYGREEDDVSFFGQILFFGKTRWFWVKVVLLGMFLVTLLASFLTIRKYNTDHEQDVQRQKDQDAQVYENSLAIYNFCLSGNDLRVQLRNLVVFSYSQNGGTDLTVVPGFDQVDSDTQEYLRNLSDLLSSGGDPVARQKRIDDALANVPLRDCGEAPDPPKEN